MSVDPEALARWTNEELLTEFDRLVTLERTLVGWLYRGVVHDEVEVIGQEAVRRTGHHPNWWREKGIVHTSWTDESGLVHNPFYRQCTAVPVMRVLPSSYDHPGKAFSCLWCLASGSGSTS